MNGCGASTQNRWPYGHAEGWRRHHAAVARTAPRASAASATGDFIVRFSTIWAGEGKAIRQRVGNAHAEPAGAGSARWAMTLEHLRKATPLRTTACARHPSGG